MINTITTALKDAKTLTTAGAVVVAILLIGLVWDMTRTQAQAQIDYQTKDLEVKQSLAKTIEGNTKIMEQVLTNLRRQ